MESHTNSEESLWLYTVPLLAKPGKCLLVEVIANQSLCCSWMLLLYTALAFIVFPVLVWLFMLLPGGPAWGKLRLKLTIPGPKGWPVLGSLMEMGPLAHRRLAYLARFHNAESLMALSFGSTRVIISSKPDVAREILNSSSFANRPLKQSAEQLLFDRAIGFAPQGEYWRGLRRIAANHLFSPRRIASHEAVRQLEAQKMLDSVGKDAWINGGVLEIRQYLRRASLNNIMSTVFGRRYDFDSRFKDATAEDLQAMISEGFDLLGAFNWSDHLPALRAFDPQRVNYRCSQLVPRVKAFVQNIIDEHRRHSKKDTSEFDFVDELLSLESEDKLHDSDIIAILWEMIFRGTDTTAILTEWILAELILHPDIQKKAQKELDSVVGNSRPVQEADILMLPYLQAIIKESLRIHPPGPLLSWARLSTEDVTVGGHYVPKGTTAMVNMWSITHNPEIWSNPQDFIPERFMPSHGGEDIDVRGNDLRLAPFGAGRRVCPGRALGLLTVQLWLARLLQHYNWLPSEEYPVDLNEVLKLSCEMASPLKCCPVERAPLFGAKP